MGESDKKYLLKIFVYNFLIRCSILTSQEGIVLFNPCPTELKNTTLFL